MGDMGEIFNAMHEAKKEKRTSNTQQSTELLTKHKISFQSKNSGAHLVVWAGNYDVDFWPSTGLWMVRGQKKRNRGIRSLIEFASLHKS